MLVSIQSLLHEAVSFYSDVPVRLKKELDTVLNLQGDLDKVDKAILITRSTISYSLAS